MKKNGMFKNGRLDTQLIMFFIWTSFTLVNAFYGAPPKMSAGVVDWRYPDYIVNPIPPCPFEGVFAHPRNCTWYYRCHKIENIQFFRRFYFQCEAGSVFSDYHDQCLFPKDVNEPCKYAYQSGLQPPNQYSTRPPTTLKVSLATKTTAEFLPLSTTQSTIIANIIKQPQKCSLSYSQCRMHDVCTMYNGKTTNYLCNLSFSECHGDGFKTKLCRTNELYDPSKKQCITKLCPLNAVNTGQYPILLGEIGSPSSPSTIDIPFISSTFTTKVIVTSTEISTESNTGNVLESTEKSTPNGTSTQLKQCFTSYSQCKTYAFCNSRNERGTRYLCSSALSECQGDDFRTSLCLVGHLYDPNKNECITNLCPLQTTNIGKYEITNTENHTSGSSSTSTSETVSNISSTSNASSSTSSSSESGSEIKQCFTSYSQCKTYEFCTIRNERGTRYLCSSAFSECQGDGFRTRLCLKGHLYDPNRNECITNLCPLQTISTGKHQIESSSGSQVNESSSSESVSGSSSSSSSGASTESSSTSESEQSKQCFSSYSKCKTYEFCTVKNERGTRYLCYSAFSECQGDSFKTRLCLVGHLYDPNRNECITNLCPLQITSIIKHQVTSTSSTDTSGSSQSSGTSTNETVLSSISNSTSSSSPSSSSSESEAQSKQCFTSYSKCKTFEFCTIGNERGTRYLCSSASSECQSDGFRSRLCLKGHLYDPNRNECITNLCPLQTTNVGKYEETSTENHTSGSSNTSTSETISNISSTSTASSSNSTSSESGSELKQCATSYSQCKTLEFCTIRNEKGTRYLCSSAFSECQGDGLRTRLCLKGHLYDPNRNECITNLCPLQTISTGNHQIESSSSGSQVNESSSSESVSGSSSSSSSGASTESSSTSESEQSKQCFSSYSKCKTYEFCTVKNERGTRYLCYSAFSECQGDSFKTRLCLVGHLYDPNRNECITNLCPLQITSIIKHQVTSTSSTDTSGSSQSSGTSTNETVLSSISNSTSSSSPSSSSSESEAQSKQCFTSYSKCKTFEFCTIGNERGTRYLCSSASSECQSDGFRSRLCLKGHLYDPNRNECITNLCPLQTTNVGKYEETSTENHTSGSSNTSTSETISNISSTSTASSSNSTSSESGSELKQCATSYSQCKTLEFCTIRNEKGTRYLCSSAFSECQGDGLRTRLCLKGHLYDPNRNECITNLCPLQTISTGNHQIESSSSGSQVNESSSSESVSGSSSSSSFGASTESSSTSESEQSKQCFSSYSKCKTYEFCTVKNERGTRYLCYSAFSECQGDSFKTRLCLEGHLYDPNRNECITNLCPIQTTSIGKHQVTTTSGTDTSGSSQSSGTSTNETVSNNNLNSTASSSTDSSSSESGTQSKQCFTSYSQCKTFEFCTIRNERGTRYLCSSAFSECQSDGFRTKLCLEGHLYDPNKNECITNLCPLQTTNVGKYEVTSTENHTSGSSSISTSETVSNISSNSNASSSISSSSVSGSELKQCFTSYSQCKTYEFCTIRNERGTRYLCSSAFSECQGNGFRTRLCLKGHLYDPNRNECITNLCPLQTISTGKHQIESSSGSQVNESSSSESISGSSSSSSSGASTESSSTSESEQSKQCFSSYSKCKTYEFCTVKNERGTRYLCYSAFSECQGDSFKTRLCLEGHLYDPNRNECITNLCPIQTTSIGKHQVTTTSGTDTSGTSESSGTSTNEAVSNNNLNSTASSSTGSSSSESGTQSKQCFTSYSKCKTYEFCTIENERETRYLCSSAFSECQNDGFRMKLCLEGHLYDPNRNECITNLCPLQTTNVGKYEETSTENHTSGSSSTSTSETISNTSSTSTASSSTSSSSESGSELKQCFTSYSQCKTYEFCTIRNERGTRYLCSSAFSECQSDGFRTKLCLEGHLYDPNRNECITNLCPLQTTNVGKYEETSTENHTPGSSSTSTGETISNTSSTSTASSSTSSSSESGSELKQCFTSYSQCKTYEFCTIRNEKGTRYLCSSAFSECQSDGFRTKLCLEGHLYDPNRNECITNLCPLQTTNVGKYEETSTENHTSGSSSTSTSETISNTSSTSTASSSTSSSSESGSELKQCFTSYSQCKTYEFCTIINERGTRYLCSSAFLECQSDGFRTKLCLEGHLYDPNRNECITNLCPLQTTNVGKYEETSTENHTPGSSSTSTSETISNTSSTSTASSSTSSSSESGSELKQCFTSYSQCKTYEFCTIRNERGTRYLCSSAFLECQNDGFRTKLCLEGHLYDPNRNECITNLCPLQTTNVGKYEETSTENHTPGSSSTSTSVTISNTSSTSTASSSTSSSSESGSELKQCFTSYSQCKTYEFCTIRNEKGTRYLCSSAFSECQSDGFRTKLCLEGHLYDPNRNECITNLCPLQTTNVGKYEETSTENHTSGSSSTSASETVSNISLTTTASSSTSTTSESLSELKHCLTSSSQCQTYEFCTIINERGRRYLCSSVFLECQGDGFRTRLCLKGHLYDPNRNECITNLCPLQTISTGKHQIESLSGSQVNESSSSESISGSSSSSSSGASTESSSTSESEQSKQCFSSYSKCKTYEFCTVRNERGTRYLCYSAFSECQGDSFKTRLCLVGHLYDPNRNECITNLCPLQTTSIVKQQVTSTNGTDTSGSSGTFTSEIISSTFSNSTISSSTSSSSDTETQSKQCFSSYSQCKAYPFCKIRNERGTLYLCSSAFSECQKGFKTRLCLKGYLYDPNRNECITNLCPLHTTNIGKHQIEFLTGNPVNESSSPESVSGSSSITASNSTVSSTSGSGTQSKQCFSSYTQCRTYEFCTDRNERGTLYLCSSAFSECQGNDFRTRLCLKEHLYDPNRNECITNLCPIKTVSIGKYQTVSTTGPSTSGSSSSSSNLSTNSNFTSSSSQGSSLESGSQLKQCFSSYSRCKTYEFCTIRNVRGILYLCSSAFSECEGNGFRTRLCLEGHLYDPNRNECITNLCPLRVTIVGKYQITSSTGNHTSGSSSISTSEEISITSSNSTSSSSQNSSSTESGSKLKHCFTSYSKCKTYEFCTMRNEKGTSYLCSSTFSECEGDIFRTKLCLEGHLYDPNRNECISNLCPLRTTSVGKYQMATTSGTNISGTSGISTSEEISSTSSNSTSSSSQGSSDSGTKLKQCFTSYSKCKSYDFCTIRNEKGTSYLCTSAFSECEGDSFRTRLCLKEHLFDPNRNECITNLCPLKTTSVGKYQMTTTSGSNTSGSSGSFISEEISNTSSPFTSSSSSSTSSTSETVTQSNIDPSIVNVTINCFSYYSQCRHYDICYNEQSRDKRYLCLQAHSECSNGLNKKHLCSVGQMFDPVKNECIKQLCPLVVISLLIGDSVSSTTSGSTIASGNFDGSIASTEPTGNGAKIPIFTVTSSSALSSTTESEKHMPVSDIDTVSTVSSVASQNSTLIDETNAFDSTVIFAATTTQPSVSHNIGTKPSAVTVTINCTSSFSFCRNYEICYNNQIAGKRYLCRQAYSECANGLHRKILCSVGNLYDPSRNECVKHLCPLSVVSLIIHDDTPATSSESSSEVTSKITPSIATVTEIVLMSTVGVSSGSISDSVNASDIATESTIPSVSTIETISKPKKCFTTFSKCKIYEFCTSNNKRGALYLCSSAFSECQGDSFRTSLCLNSYLYDPSKNECISSLCPLKSSSTDDYSTTSSSNNQEFGSSISPTSKPSSSASISTESQSVSGEILLGGKPKPSPVSISANCFYSYSQCRKYDICFNDKSSEKRYLCLQAYSECTKGLQRKLLCAPGNLFDPVKNECVRKLCPLGVVSLLIHVGTSGATSLVGSGGTTSAINESVQTKGCISSYSQCKIYKFCTTTGKSGTRYICATAFSECQSNGLKMRLCLVGHLYDPKEKECITNLCPLYTTSIGNYSITSSSVNLISSSSISNISNSVSSSATAIGGSSIGSSSIIDNNPIISTSISNTIGSHAIGISGTSSEETSDEDTKSPTISPSKCFSSYSQCRKYDICYDNKLPTKKYLCIQAHSQCTNSFQKKNLCPSGNLFDPVKNECIKQLCPLIIDSLLIIAGGFESSSSHSLNESSISTVSGSSTATDINKESASISPESVAGISSFVTISSSDTSGSEVVVSPSSISIDPKPCIKAHADCRTYEFCTQNSGKGTRYLCFSAFSECQGNGLRSRLCLVGHLYDPSKSECITNLCPLQITSTGHYSISTISGHNITESTNSSSVINSSSSFGEIITGGGIENDPLAIGSVSITSNSNFSFPSSYIDENSCFVSYSYCQMHDICYSLNIKDKRFLCREAISSCYGSEIKRKLCGKTNYLFDPNTKECVTDICPYSSFSITNEINLLASNSSVNYPSLRPQVLNYTEFIHCQLKYLYCKSFNGAELDSHNKEVLCVCSDICHFRGQKILKNFVCGLPFINFIPGNCNYSLGSEYCSIGLIKPSPTDEGKSLMRLQSSLIPEKRNQLIATSSHVDVSKSPSFRDAAHFCSYEKETLKTFWIKHNMCSDIALCIRTSNIEVMRVRSLCSNYVQCTRKGRSWQLQVVECPKNWIYSYEKEQCVKNNLDENCFLFNGGEPSVSLLRLLDQHLPSYGRLFVNRKISTLLNI